MNHEFQNLAQHKNQISVLLLHSVKATEAGNSLSDMSV
jgi:hypothetical protein